MKESQNHHRNASITVFILIILAKVVKVVEVVDVEVTIFFDHFVQLGLSCHLPFTVGVAAL